MINLKFIIVHKAEMGYIYQCKIGTPCTRGTFHPICLMSLSRARFLYKFTNGGDFPGYSKEFKIKVYR